MHAVIVDSSGNKNSVKAAARQQEAAATPASNTESVLIPLEHGCPLEAVAAATATAVADAAMVAGLLLPSLQMLPPQVSPLSSSHKVIPTQALFM
jgi:hypothetical protein